MCYSLNRFLLPCPDRACKWLIKRLRVRKDQFRNFERRLERYKDSRIALKLLAKCEGLERVKVTVDTCKFVSRSREQNHGLLDAYKVAAARFTVLGTGTSSQIEVEDYSWWDMELSIHVMASENRFRSRHPDVRALVEIEVASRGV